MSKHLSNPKELELIEPIDPILNRKIAKVTAKEISSPFIQDVVDRMLELAAGKGYSKRDSRQMVGLAAPQLGVDKQVVIIDVTADGSLKDQTLCVLINPKITRRSRATVPGREGCWSCGNICGNVRRNQQVTVEALDKDGQPVSYQFTDFVARIAQHEIDHLQGIRFPDRIPLDKPERLHWVKPQQFPAYRLEWMHWPHLCPRERWEQMKAAQQGRN